MVRNFKASRRAVLLSNARFLVPELIAAAALLAFLVLLPIVAAMVL